MKTIEEPFSQEKRSFFPTKDMHTPPHLTFAPVLMKDAQCAESNEESIF